MSTPIDNFNAIKHTLPKPVEALGLYISFVQVGVMVYVSGHGSMDQDGKWIVGKVGRDLSIEEANHAARLTGLSILATLNKNLESISEVKRVVKVLGMVNAVDDFEDHPKVIDGCTHLFKEIWGEKDGIGARSAIGVSSLPKNIPVEIEAIFEMKPSIKYEYG